MKCPNCGNENSDSAKFCKSCGETLNKPIKKDSKNKKIIIALLIIIAILAVGVLYGMGVFKGEVPLETKDFSAFKLDVPIGSDYVLKDLSSTNKSNLFVGYENKGDYKDNAFGFFAGNNIKRNTVIWSNHLYERDGEIEVYKNDSSNEEIYSVYYNGGKGQIVIIGSDVDTMKKMAKTFKDFDENKISSGNNQPATTSSSQTTASSPAPSSSSSMSIKSGSFSTGSAEEDKTYASIYVGKEHAGESVTVQIWYSRDGNTLNNGNMVPATVHSDGYLEIASADAYHYYPDHATINLYNSAGSKIDSKSVNLSPTSGTQTF